MTNEKCDVCGSEIDANYKDCHTRNGLCICSYECMESHYADEIPEDEDFLCVAR